MLTTVRRLFWLGVFGGGGYAAYTTWRRRTSPDVTPAPEWPPLAPRAPANATTAPADAGVASSPDIITVVPPGSVAVRAATDVPDTTDTRVPAFPAPLRWMPPVEGACPVGYQVKANDNSGIYHVPGGRFYDRTIAERCYASTGDAEADGYRAAKA